MSRSTFGEVEVEVDRQLQRVFVAAVLLSSGMEHAGRRLLFRSLRATPKEGGLSCLSPILWRTSQKSWGIKVPDIRLSTSIDEKAFLALAYLTFEQRAVLVYTYHLNISVRDLASLYELPEEILRDLIVSATVTFQRLIPDELTQDPDPLGGMYKIVALLGARVPLLTARDLRDMKRALYSESARLWLFGLR